MFRIRFPKLLTESVPTSVVASEQVQEGQMLENRDKCVFPSRLDPLHLRRFGFRCRGIHFYSERSAALVAHAGKNPAKPQVVRLGARFAEHRSFTEP